MGPIARKDGQIRTARAIGIAVIRPFPDRGKPIDRHAASAVGAVGRQDGRAYLPESGNPMRAGALEADAIAP